MTRRTPLDTRRTLAGLALLGLSAEAVYLGLFTLRFPLLRLYDILPPVDYAKLTGYRLLDAGALLVAYALLVGGLAYLWRRGTFTDVPRVGVVLAAGALVFAGTLLWVYPVFAIDMLFYALHARIWVKYGANPLIVPPSRFLWDPWIALKGEWVNTASPYSPLWEGLASLPARAFGPDQMGAIMLSLKAIAALAYLADAYLVARLAATLWPESWPRRALIFAWNPLVLLELVGNGHNDGVMLVFLLLAVWLLVARREMAAHVALALAALIKVTPLFLWPLLWVWGLARRPTWAARLRYTLAVAAVVAGTLAVFAVALWPDPWAWQAPHEGDTAGRSPQALAILIAMAYQVPEAYTRVQRGFQAGFLLVYAGLALWLARRTWQAYREGESHRQAVHRLLAVWFGTLVAVIILFASNWRPWYATWLLALAPLLRAEAVQAGALALSFTALTGDVFWTNLAWRFHPYLPQLRRHFLGVPWVYGVPLGVGWWWKGEKRGVEMRDGGGDWRLEIRD